MYQTINKYEFVNAFDKQDRADNFSRAGRFALFDHLEEREEEDGEKMEFDVIEICGDYSEFSTALEAAEAFGWEGKEEAGEDDDTDAVEELEEQNEADALAWLEDQTSVVKFVGGIIIRDIN